MNITQSRLKELLHYDPETGVFKWKSGARAGKVAGHTNVNGYIQIRIGSASRGSRLRAHRLAWLWVSGEIPKVEIDHINGVRSDNRIENLRLAESANNNWNRTIASNNTSGIKGVSRDGGAWRVQCEKHGRRRVITGIQDIELAELVASELRSIMHGTFQRDC